MASITSVISFFILLLATFSSSAPIGQEYGTSTSNYEYTTNPSMVEHEESVNMRLISDDDSTVVPTTQADRTYEVSSILSATASLKPRNYEEFSVPSSTGMNEKRNYEEPSTESREERNYEESSTGMNEKRNYKESSVPSSMESEEKRNYEESSTGMNEKRNYKESSVPSSMESEEKRNYEESSTGMNEKRDVLYSKPIGQKPKQTLPYKTSSGRTVSNPSSFGTNPKRAFEDYSYTTMESSTEFNQRAIRPVESEEIESSTSMNSENEMDVTTNYQPSSSFDSFGKYTGLLSDEMSSTSEYETTEEPKTYIPVKSQRLTETISIIPGKITQTEIYANAPSKTSVVVQPLEQKQLSQVQNQPVAQKTKSNN